MTSGAGYVCDGDTVGTRFESYAIVVVAHVDIGDGYVCAGADVKSVCVFGFIGALGCCVHFQVAECYFLAVSFDRVEDVGWVFLPQV